MTIGFSAARPAVPVKHALAVGLGVLAFAGLLTFSRGGVITMAAAAAVCIGAYFWKSLLGRKSLILVAAMAAVICTALFIHGYEPLARRLATLRDSRSLEELSHGRRALWSALLDGIPHFAVLGSGIGSHREVYPMFMDEHFDVEFTHGENGYLPLLLEAGVPGLLLMSTGIAVCFLWCTRILFPGIFPLSPAQREALRHDRMRPLAACAGAILPGLVASSVHSLGDFVWYLSACMSVTVILAACACRLCQLSLAASSSAAGRSRQRERHHPAPGTKLALVRLIGTWLTPGCSGRPPASWSPFRLFAGGAVPQPRLASLLIASVVLLVSAGMVKDRFPAALAGPHWDRYRALAFQLDTTILMHDDAAAEPASPLVRHLEQTLERDPDDPRANIRMAAVCLRQFEVKQKHAQNPMGLSQIRDAALASQFPTREAQDAWLEVAVGENRGLLDRALGHCRRGLQLCPLQGEGYVYLADLSFLEGPRAAAKDAYIAQAHKVRPYNGTVQFAIGKEAILAGDLEKAIHFWKQAFHQDSQVQSLIIESFAAQLPASFFLANFEPDTTGLARLYQHYRKLRRDDDTRLIGTHYAAALAREADIVDRRRASDCWHQARAVYVFLGEDETALACQQNAVALAPNDFGKRRTLAALLASAGRYGEAVEHLQWCLHRKPDDRTLINELAAAKRRRLQQRPPSVSTGLQPSGNDKAEGGKLVQGRRRGV